MAFADVDPAEYVAIVVPGGRAPEFIRNDADAQRIVRHFMTTDAPVAALCHGPLLLAAAGTPQGRKLAAYPALAPDVVAAGGEFVDGAAVVDGQLFTGRAWPDHPSWMRAFMEYLRKVAPA
ncbi:MAG TPA: DJ-1/PfpI family protein [Pseudonocardiaceae bacterium]